MDGWTTILKSLQYIFRAKTQKNIKQKHRELWMKEMSFDIFIFLSYLMN